MIFVDTHTHLYLGEFDNDIEETIARSVEKGVKYLLIPNIDSSSVDGLHALCKHFPLNCFPMMGIHPTSVKENFRDELKIIENQFKTFSFIAVGEIGIDLYWDKTYLEEQKAAFLFQLDLALEYKLPVVIHSRNSLELIIKILEDNKKYKEIQGVFHCFPGSYEQATKVVNMGFYLGIGGVVSYNKSTMADVAARIPLEHLLLETDAPFLTPHPYRGKRNESAYIAEIAAKIAELRNITVETVSEVTTRNAFDLFHPDQFKP